MMTRIVAVMLASSAAAPASSSAPLTGIFGGIQSRVVLTADGGTIETGCAAGIISGPVHVDDDGRFTATGSYDEYTPGMQAADAAPARRKVQYSGVIDGARLDLTVRAAGAAPLSFTLERDRRSKIIRCA